MIFPSAVRSPTLLAPHAVLLAIVLVVTCGLRFWMLGKYSFDPDEMFSVNAALAGWTEMFRIIVPDISHPPLFYVLLKGWLSIGPPLEAWVRVLPAMFGAATLVPLYGITRLLRLGLGATAVVLCLFAVNGEMVYFAQHARMFSMLQFWSVLSIFCFLRYLLAGTPRPSLFWWLTAVNVLMVYTHYWGWTIIAAQFVIVLALERRSIWSFVKSASLVALAFLPWAVAVALAVLEKGSATQQIAWMGEPGAWGAAWLFVVFHGYSEIPASRAISAGLCIAAALVLVARPMREGERFPAWCWAVLLGVPIVLTLGLGYASGQAVWGERHMLIVGVPYYMLLAAATERLPWKRAVPIAQAVLIVWSVIGGASAAAAPYKKAQWQSLIEDIDAISPEGPVVVRMMEPYEAAPLTFYAARHAPRLQIVLAEDSVENPPDGEFWLVYRPFVWKEARSPEDILRASGHPIIETVVIERRKGRRGWNALALRVGAAER